MGSTGWVEKLTKFIQIAHQMSNSTVPPPPRNYRRASGLATSNPVPLPIPIIGPSHGETFLEIMLYTATLPSGYGSGRPEPKVL